VLYFFRVSAGESRGCTSTEAWRVSGHENGRFRRGNATLTSLSCLTNAEADKKLLTGARFASHSYMMPVQLARALGNDDSSCAR
jgi:hypothetical protein